MTNRIFNNATWGRALSLRERHTILRNSSEDRSSPHFDQTKADRLFQNWRRQPPFSANQYFAWLLEQKKLTEDEFLETLGVDAEELADTTDRPQWVSRMQHAFNESEVEPYEPAPGEEELGFLNLVDPLIEHALYSLRDVIDSLLEQYPVTPINVETIQDIFINNLPGQLIQRLGRTMVLELNVMRLQDQLEGETAHDRFISFVRKLRDPNVAETIFDEYPILARQVAICIDQWQNVSAEFLQRVCADYELLKRSFSPDEDPGALVEVAAGAGDTHRRGRTVMIATFESGLRVVYKPKSLAIDIHFQDLLEWLNEVGCEPPLRTFTTIDREEYGWAELVRRADCTSEGELHRFYQRQGIYLALMYVLAANDFHYENVIASGEHPMLIDLETMLQPLFDRFDVTSADSIAAKQMSESVLTIGLLPMRIWSGADYQGIDISGLGGAGGQLSPDRIPGAADIGTDAMRYVRERVEIEGDANRPVLEGVEANAIDYIDDITTGFEMMYRLIHENRGELLKPGGLIEAFADDAIRVLMRPTRTYGQLIHESFHPDMLRDAVTRELFVDRLWLVIPARNHMREVIRSETTDIMQGDIPVFTSYPSTLTLYDAMGNPIENVLIERGIDVVRERITGLNEADLQRQLWHIQASIATIAEDEVETGVRNYELFAKPHKTTQLIDQAKAAADYLCDTAIESDDEAAWIGLQAQSEAYWAIGTQGLDLYSGTPGITLFLAYAGTVLNESRYTDLARKGYTATQRRAEYLADDILAIGAYEGWGGLIHAFLHLGALWKDEEILFQSNRMANRIWGFIEQDRQYGVVRGSAGAIQALLALNSVAPQDSQMILADMCADRLADEAQQQEKGLGWPIERFGERALAGYAHGGSGIAVALFQLYGVTGNDRHQQLAAQALDYERSLFRSSGQNWPDLRTGADYDHPRAFDTERNRAAWCHGSTGVALARLLALDVVNEEMLAAEASTALATTLQHGFGYTHCLCHGDLGNLDILYLASQRPAWAHYRSDVNRLLGMIVDSIARVGWQCGGPAGVLLPGMMLGVAGIGYQMLRFAEPEAVPSILSLQRPFAV